MAAHRNSSCQAKKLVGRLVWHEVSFCGPDTVHNCELPVNQRGHVDHVFSSLSIYDQIFTTTASTSPTALQIVGSPGPISVTVLKPSPGALRKTPSTGNASQELEHQPGTGVGLPRTATASFTTSTDRGGAPPSTSRPAINVWLKP